MLTNKPVRASRDILAGLGLAASFFQIYGGNSFETKKPDPLGANTLMHEAGVTADETVMVGDSEVDILTARNAGMWSIGVTYGFAPHTLELVVPDVLVDTPAELAMALSGQALPRLVRNLMLGYRSTADPTAEHLFCFICASASL